MITMTDEWFENSRTMNLLGVKVPLIGLENLIASKMLHRPRRPV